MTTLGRRSAHWAHLMWIWPGRCRRYRLLIAYAQAPILGMNGGRSRIPFTENCLQINYWTVLLMWWEYWEDRRTARLLWKRLIREHGCGRYDRDYQDWRGWSLRRQLLAEGQKIRTWSDKENSSNGRRQEHSSFSQNTMQESSAIRPLTATFATLSPSIHITWDKAPHSQWRKAVREWFLPGYMRNDRCFKRASKDTFTRPSVNVSTLHTGNVWPTLPLAIICHKCTLCEVVLVMLRKLRNHDST